ncbi:MAG: lytic polysaccharide monooxygenase [Pseudomonadales bacterium]|nr:lytic polysaccharide monooxygenase [Pseudomonadales bacterium]
MTANSITHSRNWLRYSLSLSFLLLAGVSHLAAAHIDLQRAGTHVAKYEQGERGRDTKIGACGNPEGVPTGAVYTYRPGETITIALAEYVRHPGYFRIAFDEDGDDDFMDPRWIVPVDPENRAGGCPIDDTDQCRLGDQASEGDFFNNTTVLLDNLNPHTRDTAQATYTWNVTLPNVECDNCTLQIIQVMEDPAGPAHGVYNTTTQDDDNDVYHQCIDLVLTPSAIVGQAANAAAKALAPSP